MSDPYGNPLPPGHGEDETWSQEIPVCPVCGGGVRAEILPRFSATAPTRGPWRCDLHGEVIPRWEQKGRRNHE